MEYEDFYDKKYNYFDSTIADLKEQLKKEVKQEIQNKISTLEKENEELKNVKENWKKIKREYYEKEKELEDKKNRLEYDFTYKKFSDLLDKFTNKVYGVESKWTKKKKCNICDDNRKITLKDCFGREHKVDCKCDEYDRSKCVEEKKIYISEISRDNYKKNLRMFIKEYNDISDSFSTSVVNDDVIFLEKFELKQIKEKDYKKIYFYTQKEAQKYADYLNSIEDSL